MEYNGQAEDSALYYAMSNVSVDEDIRLQYSYLYQIPGIEYCAGMHVSCRAQFAQSGCIDIIEEFCPVDP